jgi:beta-glucosidase
MVGRPYELGAHVDRLAAVLCAFFPGEEGAVAVSDVLAGRVNPSGRLPVSFPGGRANQPATYLGAPLTRLTQVSSVDPSPLFPFGHGLSYHPVTWVSVDAGSAAWPTDGSAALTVRLRNTAESVAREVVQVYLHDPVAEVARPVQQLVAAAAVELQPQSERTVKIAVPADLTSYTGRDGSRRVDPGHVELRVGRSSGDLVQVLPFELTGPARLVGRDRELFAGVELGD